MSEYSHSIALQELYKLAKANDGIYKFELYKYTDSPLPRNMEIRVKNRIVEISIPEEY